MKVHYINILLFALPLNILVNTHKKPHTTPRHTETTRLLCECDLYIPNYDNDPQMKEVMQQFEDRTTQRFEEYEERMNHKRQKCKDRCDKEIQKIILKDKLEKQMAEQFATLDTDIQSDAIPTCICEKSIADKVEKDCLRCGYGLGTVAPTVGLLGTVAVHAWKPAALKATIAAALKLNTTEISAAAKTAGDAVGAAKVIKLIQSTFKIQNISGQSLGSYITTNTYTDVTSIYEAVYEQIQWTCLPRLDGYLLVGGANPNDPMCSVVWGKIVPGLVGQGKGVSYNEVIQKTAETIVSDAKTTAVVKAAKVTSVKKAAVETTQKGVIDAASIELYNAIGYSVLAIIIIVLIMVIIYLILRYRRKKKMKKKLQYIKLLEE